jgi:hypothetical protein
MSCYLKQRKMTYFKKIIIDMLSAPQRLKCAGYIFLSVGLGQLAYFSSGFSAPAESTEYENQAINWQTRGFWEVLWGYTPPSGIQLGMWSWHYFFTSPFGSDTNWQQNLIGYNYKSLYLATFSNSQFRQTFSAGVRRNLWAENKDEWRLSFGYNAGIALGYKDGRGLSISRWSPIIPILQIFYDIAWHGFGVEFAMVPSVASIGFRYEFL